MKIFKSFSFIVTMMFQVVSDIKVFILFFIIMIVMFSMIFNVIAPPTNPEYSKVGLFAGNLLTTFRTSLGDFDFGALEGDDLSQKQHIIFWVCWIIVILFSMLIFLSFIIAEVSNTYQTVKDRIESLI